MRIRASHVMVSCLRNGVALLAVAVCFYAPGAQAQITAGDLDSSFGNDGRATLAFGDSGQAVAVRSDGIIVVAGNVRKDSSSDWGIAWVTPDGSLDPSFGTSGTTTVAFDIGGSLSDNATALVLLPDNRVVIAGNISGVDDNSDMGIARLTSSGVLDSTFGQDGKTVVAFDLGGFNIDYAADLAIQDDGKIVVVGTIERSTTSDRDFGVVRLQADGEVDIDFGSGGKVVIPFNLGGEDVDVAAGVTIQSDGRIVVCGAVMVDSSGSTDMAVARLDADGDLDSTFGSGGKVTIAFGLDGDDDSCAAVAVLGDGKIVLAGNARVSGSDSDFAIARLNPDGSLDLSFDGDGIATLAFDGAGEHGDYATSLLVQTDGKIVVSGFGDDESLTWNFVVGRFLATGQQDSSFGIDGRAAFSFGPGETSWAVGRDACLQPDSKIVAVGYVGTDTTNSTKFGLIRLLNDLVFSDGFESGYIGAWSN